ncbi:SDR family oxidoreductase [Temperatibacter marinus]|uniref:SDR family oxidoreductase n=1 Tax=Temperatibacter marinus TaxID=1456591 RepID=A0AA52EH34_9PROT|nr:SDR family oxidoreductase [Temperatibacter marinus]WND03033.1 SDR family oxidoreductase [Temperatibacter marinus]
MQTLKDKVAVVTGAGKGIGKACVLKLAAEGAHVIAVARTESDLQAVMAESSGSVEAWAMDVTSQAFLSKIEGLECIDILVNNAGTNRPEAFTDVSEENLDFVMNLNVKWAFLVSQAVVNVMKKAGKGGSIIHMSSQMGHVGSPNRSVYCMTKHAIEGLSKAMAVELGPENIRVNTIAPTFIETPMTKPMLENPEFMEFVNRMIPLGRIGKVDDIAAAVSYLASGSASMVTGTSLKVDGGWTAH